MHFFNKEAKKSMNKKMNIRALIFRVADAALRMGGGGNGGSAACFPR